jgi:hypothetical protein
MRIYLAIAFIGVTAIGLVTLVAIDKMIGG